MLERSDADAAMPLLRRLVADQQLLGQALALGFAQALRLSQLGEHLARSLVSGHGEPLLLAGQLLAAPLERLAWLTWLGVHLLFLVGYRNRAAVLLNWIYNYVTYDRASRLIVGWEEAPRYTEGEDLDFARGQEESG